MILKPGDRVERFVVDGVIGVGGTATVYRVHHERLGTRHALKVLALGGDMIRDRLLVEGQAQASLNHPNVVAVTDVVNVNGQPGLLMEFVEGHALDDALKSFPFTLDDVENLFYGILEGVGAAHAAGLVHRDLKLANILLEQTDAGFVPKITDFGLAKVLYNRPKDMEHTRVGVAMGTPGFMAPEQVRDAGSVDHRADMFSLGCVLYEMVSGQPTFPGTEILEIYLKVTKVDYEPIRTYVPDLPDRFEAAIRGCLQKDLDHRIPDCETLRAVLTGELGWDLGPVEPAPIASLPPNTASLPPVEQVDPAPRSVPASRSSTERVLPFVLVGGSVSLLLMMVLFAGAAIGLPLLLANSEAPLTHPKVVADIPHWEVPAVHASGIDQLPQRSEQIAQFEDPHTVLPRVPRPAPVTPRSADFEDPNSVLPRSIRDRPQAPALPPAALEQQYEDLSMRPAPVPAPAPPPPVGDPITLKFFSRPPSAALTIDGVSTGLRTPARLEVPPGPHRIGMELIGQPPTGFDLYVKAGTPERWCIDFLEPRVLQGTCPK